MKSRERAQHYQHFWATGLTVALILLGQFLTADAQTTKPKITTVGADDTFESVFSQPAQFLQAIGITSEEVQRALEPRARIAVVGAGFTRDVGLSAFTDTQNVQAQSSIQVAGAGSARILGLVAFTELPNPPSKTAIHVAGAGSVRDIGLVAPEP